MTDSPTADETAPARSSGTIYDRAATPAKSAARRDATPSRGATLLRRAATGTAFGAAVWFAVSMLGFPHVFNVGVLTGLGPAMVVGTVVGATPWRRLIIVPAVLLLVLVLVIAYTDVMVAPARSLIRRDPVPAVADAVVVLSAGLTADGFLSQQGFDRLLKGVELMRAGVAPAMVITREEETTSGRRITSDRDQARIVALARIPEPISAGFVRSTHDEAISVARIAKERGWRRVVVVTSPFHSWRACRAFERAGLTVSCVPSESRDISVVSLDSPGDRLGAFASWVYETAATIKYWQRGWL